jgi:phytoene/squalene synthetase
MFLRLSKINLSQNLSTDIKDDYNKIYLSRDVWERFRYVANNLSEISINI